MAYTMLSNGGDAFYHRYCFQFNDSSFHLFYVQLIGSFVLLAFTLSWLRWVILLFCNVMPTSFVFLSFNCYFVFDYFFYHEDLEHKHAHMEKKIQCFLHHWSYSKRGNINTKEEIGRGKEKNDYVCLVS